MFGNLLKRAASAVPKVVKAAIKTYKTVSKAVSSIPAIINAGKEKLKSEIDRAGKAVREFKADIDEKNMRILEKIKTNFEKADSSIRGKTTIGGIFLKSVERAVFPAKDALVMLDFLFESRKAIIEEYPILDVKVNMVPFLPNDVVKRIYEAEKNFAVDVSQAAGKWIYERNIPEISDFVGEFAGVREKGAPSNVASIKGAAYRGFFVKGLGGTVDGLANMAMDPMSTVEGLTKVAAYPEESLPKIWNGVKGYVDKKLINGTPEDRAEFGGQLVFEVASFLIPPAKASKVKAVGKIDDIAKTGKALDKMQDVSSGANKLKSWLDDIFKKRPKIEKGGSSGTRVLEEVVEEAPKKIKSGVSRAARKPRTLARIKKRAAKASTNAQKGKLGELYADFVMKRSGYKKLPSKVGSNNGFDGVYAKFNKDGTISDVVINESKFGSAGLGKAKMGGPKPIRQMSDAWIKKNIEKMVNSRDPAVARTGELLEEFVDNGGRITKTMNRLKLNKNNKWINKWKKLGTYP